MLTREQAIAGSPDDKKKYMDSLVIPHRNLEAVVAEVRPRMTAGVGLSITMVVGGPGIGKSSLGRMQLRQLLSNYKVQIQENPSIIPAVMVEVDSADKGHEINFALLYARLSAALLAPSALDGFGIPRTLNESIDLIKISRLMFEAAVTARELRHLILDEAIHFAHSSTDPLHYGNLLKSLSNRSGFNLLLLGAYGCEELILASGQLARRLSVVQYMRYKPCDADFLEYCTFIKSVAAAMPYRFEVDVESSLQYLFEGNFGLPGASVDVLRAAAASCAQERYPRWSDTYLRKSMPSSKAQLRFAKETLQGEDRIQPYLQMERAIEYATEDTVRYELQKESEERKRLNGRSAR